MKFRPLIWKSTHPYLIADRLEDLTNESLIQTNPKCDRNIALYGYVRGMNMQSNQIVHLLGVGDYQIQNLTVLTDPCPIVANTKENNIKKRSLNEKEKKLYAPMSDFGDVIYDEDVIYINIGDKHVNFTKPENLVLNNNEDGDNNEIKAIGDEKTVKKGKNKDKNDEM